VDSNPSKSRVRDHPGALHSKLHLLILVRSYLDIIWFDMYDYTLNLALGAWYVMYLDSPPSDVTIILTLYTLYFQNSLNMIH
jgi:hypothetical protein